jgi:hypothetical protein
LQTRPEQHAAVDAQCAPEALQLCEPPVPLPPVPNPPVDVPVKAPVPKSGPPGEPHPAARTVEIRSAAEIEAMIFMAPARSYSKPRPPREPLS